MKKIPSTRVIKQFVAIVFVSVLGACSSSGSKPKPAELSSLVPLVGARQVWSSPLGISNAAMTMSVHGERVVVSSGSGAVAMLNTANGADIWRMQVPGGLSAGIGSDGHLSAVVTQRNELVALVNGAQVWKQPLATATYTAPLVAGLRVFVLGADRSVTAFDGNSGARLWSQTRPSESLVLKQPGVLLAVGDTLIVGLAGRMVAMNPNTGAVRWETPVGTPRGANDIERMVDLIGPVSRVDSTVCARSFQTAVGCVDTQRGALKWTQLADGTQGLAGDDQLLFGTERDGRIQAWKRATGDRVWSNERLLNRGLSAPLVLGRSVAVGDAMGFIHLLSREDGGLTGRLTTDGSAIVGQPVLAGDTLLALTRNGNLFAWRPE